jgi:glycyl-tRNA synthetase beta chain
MNEFILEILCEEIPARFQVNAIADLKRMFIDGLTEKGLSFSTVEGHITPRRMVLCIGGLPGIQPSVAKEIKGPRVGVSEDILNRFLASSDLSREQVFEKETGKGAFYFANHEAKGKPTAEILKDLIAMVIGAFPWPKSMRWGSYRLRWVRPLTQIMAVFQGKLLEGGLDLGGKILPFVSTTTGHRFLGQNTIEVKDFESYKHHLRHEFVILDRAERRAHILKEIQALAQKNALEIRQDDDLLEEVVGLVEWPVAFVGHIEESFMTIPEEVLMTSMRVHQRYFSLQNKEGKLANSFIVVANTIPDDDGSSIISGNERVLRARLADARFFYDLDLKISLESRLESLKKITFHASLGTVYERVLRLKQLSSYIADKAFKKAEISEAASRASYLSKSDLVTEMVQEFTELQGVMGRYYALNDKESQEVAEAIALQYSPKGPGDLTPGAPVSIAVSMADKIDAMVGFFGVGLKPTGSKDPFALRRAALGIIRLILENQLSLSLKDILSQAIGLYGAYLKQSETQKIVDEVTFFIKERLRVYLRDQGLKHDVIASILEDTQEDRLLVLVEKIKSLEEYLIQERSRNLLGLYKRAANILRIESKKTKVEGLFGEALTQDNAEKFLFHALNKALPSVKQSMTEGSYKQAFENLLILEKPTHAFFEEVLVNHENQDIRMNRLRLLKQLVDVCHEIGDLSKIEGS